MGSVHRIVYLESWHAMNMSLDVMVDKFLLDNANTGNSEVGWECPLLSVIISWRMTFHPESLKEVRDRR